MGYYDERALHSVSIGQIAYDVTEEGPLVGVSVLINVVSADGKQLGPGATLELGIPVDPDVSLKRINGQAVEMAYDLVQRLSQFSVEELKSSLSEPPKFVFSKK